MYCCMQHDTAPAVRGNELHPPPSQKKTMLIVLSVLSILCRPSSLFGSQQLSVLGRSCAIALVWALGLPWGVWVLQHKTVNPPESWWLLIRYSHPASCPEENSSGLHSLSLPHHPPLPIHSCTPTSPHADVTTYSILCRIQAQLLAFFFSPPQLNKHLASAFCLSGGMTLVLSPSPPLSPSPFTSSHVSFSPCHSALFHPTLPVLTCHSRPVSPGRNERCGSNYHPLRECGRMLWLRVIPDHDNVCRWACI